MKILIITLILLLFVSPACSAPLSQIPPTETRTPVSTSSDTNETGTRTQTDPETEPETAAYDSVESHIAEKIAAMTIEEKIGQLFLVRCPTAGVIETAAKYQFGGYVYFAVNFQDRTREDIIDEISACQETVEIPMLFAVDEEGGTVNRVSRFIQFRETPFLSPRTLYKKGAFELIKSDTAEKAVLLLGLGINLNLAPVCDISVNPDDFIYPRTVGLDAAGTSDYVRTVVEVMNKYGIGCSLKHFPGYGNNADTHLDVVYDTREYEVFANADFLPFAAGINVGAGSVMVSHNIMTCVDDVYPASLSAEVHKLLRNELGFDGVIMTDDLAMEGIRKYTDGTEAAVLAVEAGNDMLCCSEYEPQYQAVIDAVREGRLTKERIDESVARILRWKIKLNLIKV